MRNGNIVAAFVTMLLGIFIVSHASQLPAGFGNSIGPGVFPRWLGLIIAGLSVIQIIMEFFPNLRSSGQIAWPEGKWKKQVLSVCLAVFLYLLSLDIVGFTIGTFLLVVAMIRILGQYGWIKVLALAVFSAALCTTIFQVWLEVHLPTGLLGI